LFVDSSEFKYCDLQTLFESQTKIYLSEESKLLIMLQQAKKTLELRQVAVNALEKCF